MDTFLMIVTTVFTYCSATMVRHPPSITNPRFAQTMYVRSGKTVLECSDKVGSPPSRYTWKWNGNNVVDSDIMHVDTVSGNLSIEFTKREDGEYQCLAHNLWGTSLSYVTTVIATRINPFSSKGIYNARGKEGEKFTLLCVNPPKQSPPGKFQWYFTDINTVQSSQIPEDERIAIDKEGNLNFVYLKKMDGRSDKRYACAVSNEFNDVVRLGSKTLLTVVEQEVIPESSPELISSTPSVVGYLGEEATLECIFSGNPVPSIKWYRDGNKPVVSGYVIKIEKYGRHLKILKVTEKMEGLYTCKAENKLDVAQAEIHLDVKSKPIWVTAPKSMTAVEGSDVVFTCHARPLIGEDSLVPPQWYINGQLVNTTSVAEKKFNFSRNSRHLTITNVSRDHDIMCLQCNVSNDIGYRFKDAYLNIILPITIIKKPRDHIEMERGEIINLTVEGTTDPSRTLKYEWYFNGQPLNVKLRQFVLNGTTLLIDTSVVSSDEADGLQGVYVCEVSHDLQMIYVTVNVTTVVMTTESPTTVSSTEELAHVEIVAAGPGGGTDLWMLAVVFGVLVVVAAAIVIIVIARKKNPGKTYLLGKTEIKHHLNPEKELRDHEFQQM